MYLYYNICVKSFTLVLFSTFGQRIKWCIWKRRIFSILCACFDFFDIFSVLNLLVSYHWHDIKYNELMFAKWRLMITKILNIFDRNFTILSSCHTQKIKSFLTYCANSAEDIQFFFHWRFNTFFSHIRWSNYSYVWSNTCEEMCQTERISKIAWGENDKTEHEHTRN